MSFEEMSTEQLSKHLHRLWELTDHHDSDMAAYMAKVSDELERRRKVINK